jgi:GR25 family glycosyltransferase involved in LPS biosynthesis
LVDSSEFKNLILKSIRADHGDIMITLSAELEQHRFVDLVKNSRFKFYGSDLFKYFKLLKTFLDTLSPRQDCEYWQLWYLYFEYNESWQKAQNFIRPIAYSGTDNWASYVYTRGFLKRGIIDDGVDSLRAMQAMFPLDKKLLTLNLLVPFYSGNLEAYATGYNPSSSADQYFFSTLAKLLFITRRFDDVLALPTYGTPNSTTQSYVERSKFATSLLGSAKPVDELKIYVISGSENNPRMRRFSHSMKTIQMKFEFVLGFKGENITDLVKKEWLLSYDGSLDSNKTFGAFMSHVKVWENIAKGDADGALICEDDCILISDPTHWVYEATLKGNTGILFLNNRMSPKGASNWLQSSDISFESAGLEYAKNPRTIGADCYYITKINAQTMLDTLTETRLPYVVDLFLLKHANDALGISSFCTTLAPGEHVDEEYF